MLSFHSGRSELFFLVKTFTKFVRKESDVHLLPGYGIGSPRIRMEVEDPKNLGLPPGEMCQGNSHCVNI